MNGLSFEGTVINGQIQLPVEIRLPEHAKVVVIVPKEGSMPPARIVSPRLLHPEQAELFRMDVREI